MSILSLEKYRNGKRTVSPLFAPDTLALHYHKDKDCFVLADNQGFILDRDGFEELVGEMRRTYELLADDIEAWNNDKAEEIARRGSQHRNGTDQNPGFIYLCHRDGYAGFKIGLSEDVKRRMGQLRAKLIYKFPTDNMVKAEAELHSLFQGKVIKDEWFRLDFDDIDYIRSIIKYEAGKFVRR